MTLRDRCACTVGSRRRWARNRNIDLTEPKGGGWQARSLAVIFSASW
jgi:hypothetical protein